MDIPPISIAKVGDLVFQITINIITSVLISLTHAKKPFQYNFEYLAPQLLHLCRMFKVHSPHL